MKRLFALGAVCAALGGLARPAAADPVALRHGSPDQGLVLQAGWPHVSAAWWQRPGLGFAVGWRLPASAVSAAVGTRRRVALGQGPGALDASLAGGLLVPTVDPGLALTATPALQLGLRGERGELDLGLALPVELQVLTDRRLRVPVLLEAGFSVALRPLELGLRGGLGPVLSAPGATSIALQWSLWARVPRHVGVSPGEGRGEPGAVDAG